MSRRARRIRRRSQAAKQPTSGANGRTERIVLAVSGIVVLGLVIFAMSRQEVITTEARPHDASPHAHASDLPNVEEMLRDSQELSHDFEEWFDVADEIAGQDEQAQRLVAFARANSVPSILQQGGVTAFISQGFESRLANLYIAPSLSMPRSFEVTVADMAMRQSFGLPSIADWQYDQNRNELFVPPRNRYSRAYGAIVLLHEVQHAYDVCTGAEPLETTPRQWAQGEARAYDVELRLLDRITSGASTRYARSLVDRFRVPGDQRWIWPQDTPGLMDALTEWDRIIGEPPVSDEERGPRGGTLLMLMNRELVTREHMGDESFLDFIDATRSHTPSAE